jgi:hypothetical protein
MADDPQQDPNFISVQNAIRLKHSLNQSLTWGNSNLNALEVENLTKLTAEDYARVRKQYREWKFNIVNTMTMSLLALGSVAAFIFLPNGWLKWIALVVMMICLHHLSRREGHEEGYIRGYDAGYEAGIHKVLGINPEELKRIHGVATEMKVDGMLIKRTEEREKK